MPLTTTHIDELLDRCKAGDQHAQLSVYKQYYRAMYNTAVRIVKDEAEAQDVMQESFLSAFTKLETFNGDATFGAWLKRIVVNNSLAAYKKSSKYKIVAYHDVEERLDVPDESDNGFEKDALSESPKARYILKVMGSLKDNYRLILTLYLIEGYDYDEICAIMKLNAGQCRTLVSRAKDSLRSKLTNLQEL